MKKYFARFLLAALLTPQLSGCSQDFNSGMIVGVGVGAVAGIVVTTAVLANQQGPASSGYASAPNYVYVYDYQPPATHIIRAPASNKAGSSTSNSASSSGSSSRERLSESSPAPSAQPSPAVRLVNSDTSADLSSATPEPTAEPTSRPIPEPSPSAEATPEPTPYPTATPSASPTPECLDCVIIIKPATTQDAFRTGLQSRP